MTTNVIPTDDRETELGFPTPHLFLTRFPEGQVIVPSRGAEFTEARRQVSAGSALIPTKASERTLSFTMQLFTRFGASVRGAVSPHSARRD
jgi:hypothetical protein